MNKNAGHIHIMWVGEVREVLFKPVEDLCIAEQYGLVNAGSPVSDHCPLVCFF